VELTWALCGFYLQWHCGRHYYNRPSQEHS
jgi:hypothetical protein